MHVAELAECTVQSVSLSVCLCWYRHLATTTVDRLRVRVSDCCDESVGNGRRRCDTSVSEGSLRDREP